MNLQNVLSLPEGPRRTAALAAWVQGLIADKGQVPVLVGGGAVEILAGGAYTTGDLDFVGSVTLPVRKELEEWANRGPLPETS